MKRISLLGSMLGGAMLQLLAQGGWKDVGVVASTGSKTRKRTAPKFLYLPKGLPSDARYWHDCTQPDQAAAIQAAEAKRERKADKLQGQTNQHWNNNFAHQAAFRSLDEASGFIAPLNLNPFYIAK